MSKIKSVVTSRPALAMTPRDPRIDPRVGDILELFDRTKYECISLLVSVHQSGEENPTVRVRRQDGKSKEIKVYYYSLGVFQNRVRKARVKFVSNSDFDWADAPRIPHAELS